MVVQPPRNPSTSRADQTTTNPASQPSTSSTKTIMSSKFESKAWTTTWPFQICTSSTHRKSTKLRNGTTQQQPIVSETRVYSVRHRRLPYRVEFIWKFGTFVSTCCTLHFPHNIDNGSALYMEVIRALGDRDGDDLRQLQMLLESRKITLRTTINDIPLFEVRMPGIVRGIEGEF